MSSLKFDAGVLWRHCQVVGGGKVYLDIEVGLHVFVQVGDESVAIVADGHLRETEPLDPAINEGPADLG